MCPGLWIGSADLPGAMAALHSPCRRRGSELKGFLCLVRSGTDFRARRSSTNGADMKALEVFGEWSTTEKAVVQDPGGDL